MDTILSLDDGETMKIYGSVGPEPLIPSISPEVQNENFQYGKISIVKTHMDVDIL